MMLWNIKNKLCTKLIYRIRRRVDPGFQVRGVHRTLSKKTMLVRVCKKARFQTPKKKSQIIGMVSWPLKISARVVTFIIMSTYILLIQSSYNPKN